MNRIFYLSAESILLRLSRGAEQYGQSESTFKVTCQNHPQQIFSSLPEAFIIYMTLEEAASLWDIGQGETLIERKVLMCLN